MLRRHDLPAGALPAVVAFVVGVFVLGPAWGSGGLLNLDLVVTPDQHVSPGIWGLGPEVPRSQPVDTVLAWVAQILGGPLTAKLFFLLIIVVATAGAARLLRASDGVTQMGAGLLYGLSPFLTTRLGVGHATLVAGAAVLPWVLTTLLTPARDLRRTFLAAVSMAFFGAPAGILALVVVAVGIVTDRGRRAVGVVAVVGAAQLLWFVPGAIVVTRQITPVNSSAFPTAISGVSGFFSLFSGGGFWLPIYQVGSQRPYVMGIVGLVLLVLAVVGTPKLPDLLRTRLPVLAAIGMVFTLATNLPGLSWLYSTVTSTLVGAPVREGQRFLCLTILWIAPAAALGAKELAGRVPGSLRMATRLVPVALAVVLVGPALWGIGGELKPVEFPSDWAQAAARTSEAPGTVLALPFNRYMTLDIADGRLVFNPVPRYFGGDVISSSDPELGATKHESADPREAEVMRLLPQLLENKPISPDLAKVGVRWVVLLKEAYYRSYHAIEQDPGLDLVVDGPSLQLYEVRDWPGATVDGEGREVATDEVISPWIRVDGSGPATMSRPAAPGWLRGWSATGESAVGLLTLPAGSGPVWFWPSLLVLGTQLGLLLSVVVVAVRVKIHP